jgi:hypothetical protein
MANDGDYPFVLSVWNKFKLVSTDQIKNGVNVIRVVYRFVPFNRDTHPDSILDFMQENTHQLLPGERHSFPLYWKAESVEIKLPGKVELNPSKNCYYIWSGIKAKCQLDPPANTNVKFIPSPYGEVNDELESKKKYSIGGTWEIVPNKPDQIKDKSTGKLKVRKLKHDPEEDNVTVGEDGPG